MPEELITSARQNAASRFSGVDPNKGLLDPEEATDVTIVHRWLDTLRTCGVGVGVAVRTDRHKNLTRDLPIGLNPDDETGRRCESRCDDQNVVSAGANGRRRLVMRSGPCRSRN